VKWNQQNSHGHGARVKLMLAVVGASAVVAMGALTALLSGEGTSGGTLMSEPTPTSQTVTEETPAPSTPLTSVATPEITTTPTSVEPG
jgi:hypothetical protein